MWSCPKCGRKFKKANQPHTCHTVPLDQHFKNKAKARELFDCLVNEIETKIGKCDIVSLPCCVHLSGSYDFLAALPKKDKLEIRFALDRKLTTPKLIHCVPLSAKYFKNCLDITSTVDIGTELINWLGESYYLKDL